MRFFFCSILLIIIFFAKSTNAQNVENIEIIGNKRISNETVLVLGNIDLNIFFDDQNLDKILKNLRSISHRPLTSAFQRFMLRHTKYLSVFGIGK